MKKLFYLSIAAIMIFTLSNCATNHTVTNNTTKETDSIKLLKVKANPQFISIQEGLQMMQDSTYAPKILKKYGYKYKKNYEVYRVESYKEMYYKNCSLPIQTGSGAFMDLPKAMKKGTSSYIAINNKIEIGVYNNQAYENLVGQILSVPGFTLINDGYEQAYSNGTYSIFTYAPNHRIRIQKTL